MNAHVYFPVSLDLSWLDKRDSRRLETLQLVISIMGPLVTRMRSIGYETNSRAIDRCYRSIAALRRGFTAVIWPYTL